MSLFESWAKKTPENSSVEGASPVENMRVDLRRKPPHSLLFKLKSGKNEVREALRGEGRDAIIQGLVAKLHEEAAVFLLPDSEIKQYRKTGAIAADRTGFNRLEGFKNMISRESGHGQDIANFLKQEFDIDEEQTLALLPNSSTAAS